MNYIEQFNAKFQTNGGITSEGSTELTHNNVRDYLKYMEADLLLKCKEAVGGEQETSKILHHDSLYEAYGWNSCRSTTLQNLDNLK